MKEKEMAERNLIYKIRSGSGLYGTVTEKSDEDYVGIFIPDKDYVVGVFRCEQVILNEKLSGGSRNEKGDTDFTIYSLPKFFKLARDNNPNIVEIFFANHTATIFCNKFGKKLRENYPLFLSKKAYHTFKGYAYSQRHKMVSNNGKGRDVTRKELTDEFGYDTKYASHLIRLLLEGLEILVEGRITLPLSQNNLVRDIKIGKYPLDFVLKKAEELEALIDEAYIKSPLQHSANDNAINKLQIEMLENFWLKRIAGLV